MGEVLASVNTRDADAVVAVLRAGAEANLTARCRRGAQDVISREHPTQRLIATGDLHDNPDGLVKLVELAGMGDAAATPRAHLTLHEVIHSDRLMNGMDFSYRTLVKVAALKAAFAEHVHVLLANHELSQIAGAGIVKDGVSVVEAFNSGVEYVFGDRCEEVLGAIGEFIASMPLALRWVGVVESAESPAEGADLLCAHSLPDPSLADRFDAGVLERSLGSEDFVPRRGSAHLMVWGRGHKPTDLLKHAIEMRAGLFVLGHEKAPEGFLVLEPNTIVLNTDSAWATVLEVEGGEKITLGRLVESARRL